MGQYVNDKLEAFKRGMRGKKAAVLGIGASNTPLVELLARAGASVTAFDRKEADALAPQLAHLAGLGAEYRLGPGYLSWLRGFDVVYRTPGARPDIPELASERERGAKVTSEMETFLSLCPCPVIGVTGSDGKTTTASLIHEMLKAQGLNSHLGGNIGKPLLQAIGALAPGDMAVVELSSFQLMDMEGSVDVAVVTNMSPNHLDVHKSYAEYVCAKKAIVSNQAASGLCVLNYDCEETRRFALDAPGRAAFFSGARDLASDGAEPYGCCMVASVSGDALTLRKAGCAPRRVVGVGEIRLIGAHNIANILAAACAVEAYVPLAAVAAVARSFAGVEHRIEFIRELDGVRYFNDSIATSPSRTVACLNSFTQKVVLVAGGRDKNLDYTALGAHIASNARALVLCGETSSAIRRSLESYLSTSGEPAIPVVECRGYEEAVAAARAQAQPGDVVALSPASTSHDRFNNYEERGRLFKRLVDALS